MLLTTRPRRSTSAASYSDESAEKIRQHLDTLRPDPGIGPASARGRIASLKALCELLEGDGQGNHVRDAFRHLQGLETLLDFFSATAKAIKPAQCNSDDGVIFEVLSETLILLKYTLHEHWGNAKFFRRKVHGGGWNYLATTLLPFFNQSLDEDHIPSLSQLLGCLLACGLDRDDLKRAFVDNCESQPEQILNVTRLANPEALALLFDLWTTAVRQYKVPAAFVSIYPSILRSICNASIHNQQCLHSSGLLSSLLRQLDSSFMADHVEILRQVAACLLKLGMCSVVDAAYLYNKAQSSNTLADLLLNEIKADPVPAHIHFDLSLHSHSSVELSDLRKAFPPPSGPGYTLSLWLNIVHFDPAAHTTIFGAFDASQSCFVLVYIEKDTRNLILQTSISSHRPSARFKSFAFGHSRWYHVSIVHRRSKSGSSSRASLYVDGEFVEQVKLQYPESPPPVSSGHHSESDRSRGRKFRPVQVFFGTPADLASPDGARKGASQWKLASAHLYANALSDELIAVHKELGPRYFGNYQDCLGSFQTYEASAALNLRNETLHPGREEGSEILSAIRSKASDLLPESQVLLSISPQFIIDDDEERDFDGSQLAASLSRTAQRNLRLLSRGGRTPVAINGANPSIGSSLTTGTGTAVLTGLPTIVNSLALDEAAFGLNGALPVGLSILDSATNGKEMLRALEILFGLIRNNWRNSEAVERENGYGILAVILDTKLKKLGSLGHEQGRSIPEGYEEEGEEAEGEWSLESNTDLVLHTLELVLHFVGFRKDMPENSVINNPLAYRILLVDMDLWRMAKPNVQRLYYEQFFVFIKGSKHHIFNAKRLSRMRIIKKWLDALKSEPFTTESLQLFVPAFKQLFSVAPATDSMRSLALYIAYALETPTRPPGFGLRHARSMKFFASTTGFDPPQRRSTAPAFNGGVENLRGSDSNQVETQKLAIAMLEMYADVICASDASAARKFARAVSSKWMLNLMNYDNPRVAILATKIVAYTVLANGRGYLEKFCAPKTSGPIIMKNALRRRWDVAELWVLLIGLLFGRAVSDNDISNPFDLSHLLLTFPPGEMKVTFPEFLPVIMSLLQQGLKSLIQEQSENEEPSSLPSTETVNANSTSTMKTGRTTQKLGIGPSVIETAIRFIANVHQHSQSFRDFALQSSFVKELIFTLYPFVVSSDIANAETELNSRDSALTFNGEDVVIRPISRNSERGASIVRTLPVEANHNPSQSQPKARPLRRTSSYVLVTSFDSTDDPVTPQLSAPFSPNMSRQKFPPIHNRLVEEVLELVVGVYSDQIFTRKEFAGIGLYKRIPPGFQEHQAYFASYILRNSLIQLGNTIRLKQDYLTETRVLTNVARFAMHLRETVFEGWFIDGAESVLEFLGGILEHLQQPEIAQVKSVRLCSEIIGSIRWVVERIVLLRMSEVDTSPEHQQTVALLQKVTYWHNVIFFNDGSQPQFLKLFFYLLYMKIVSHNQAVAESATNLWRILMVQQPDWRTQVQNMIRDDKVKLNALFDRVLELDNTALLAWLRENREEIDKVVSGQPAELWEDFVKVENRRTDENAKERMSKRRERLRQWMAAENHAEDVVRRYEQSSSPWRANIYRQEHSKRLRSIQDEQDNRSFNQSCWAKMQRQLRRPGGFLDTGELPAGWQLDRTEGPNRMRMRLLPDQKAHLHKYQGKEASSRGKELSLDIKQALRARNPDGANSPFSTSTPSGVGPSIPPNFPHNPSHVTTNANVDPDDEFEIVEELNDGADGFEDKNRKVMRSLERGDRVEHVCNTARINGLEAIEAILIIGKNNLYMIDNYLVRSDSEIVNIWHAPEDERDPYLQLITGHHAKDGSRNAKPSDTSHETRHWRWEDVLSISRRRFLFREVGIEIFFVDGQSFLLTMPRPSSRDDLHHKLFGKAQSVSGGLASTRPEDLWRLELLRMPEDAPQTLGSRFTNVFNSSASNTATKKWIRGEISNFHYLMLVNTMAGRTFNDLTQYPVFPWVLADYTSEELDFSNPDTFRDLTKPMGCQTVQREAEFRERYKTFAEMGDSTTPPFHYGTHYSSAMIVTSYLIRLPPFVQSYLLLQGGVFDHPDRMFYSIEKAWNSASRDNMTDVRELTPEFFCLPEMFVNINDYDFGARQGAGGKIDNVTLPPWAKGDPKIFVAKHRQALESEYVSKHLHAWIDLVFGQKQVGEAALEATNVFHHLSYRGAKNLDEIQDPVERVATIGIIHNFGQTPHQVFQRPHPQRDDLRNRSLKRLDLMAESLTRLPFPVLEAPDKVASIHWDPKREKVLAASPRMVFIPSSLDKFLEWGFVDNGLRFYAADTGRLLGLFEHVHEEQVNAASFVDSRNLVTAGRDSTVTVWTVTVGKNAIDMQLKANLFGHRKPVNALATSAVFSTLLTGDENGTVISWDLNRSELVRVIVPKGPKVDALAINNVNGLIVVASGPNVGVFTLNGEGLLDQMISTEAEDIVGCVVWYEGNAAEYSGKNMFFTGHKRGVANVWAVDIMGGRWVLEHVKRLGHASGEASGVGGNSNSVAAITSILPRESKVYIGDEDGRLFEWDCVQHGRENGT